MTERNIHERLDDLERVLSAFPDLAALARSVDRMVDLMEGTKKQSGPQIDWSSWSAQPVSGSIAAHMVASCEDFGVSLESLLGWDRTFRVVDCRNVGIHAAVSSGHSLASVGRRIQRHPATLRNSLKRVKKSQDLLDASARVAARAALRTGERET